jgi:pimeloyl-ACP methyl ester carboxylesterase
MADASQPPPTQQQQPDQPERRSILSGDVRLSIRDYGNAEAPTLIAVHGYPDNQSMWEPLARLLRDDFHVVTYDVRGAGASEAPRSRQDYVSERLVDDLVAVMDEVAPGRRVHLLGHDWGSLQMWDAVTTEASDPRLQGRIASYTSISGPCLDHMAHFVRTAPNDVRRQQAKRSWYINLFHVPVLPELMWRALHPLLGAQMARQEKVPRDARWGPELGRDGANGLQLYRANVFPRLRRPRAGTTEVPVQVVVCSDDPYMGPETVDALELDRFLGTWRRVDVASGHWLPRTDPVQVAQLVREWSLPR